MAQCTAKTLYWPSIINNINPEQNVVRSWHLQPADCVGLIHTIWLIHSHIHCISMMFSLHLLFTIYFKFEIHWVHNGSHRVLILAHHRWMFCHCHPGAQPERKPFGLIGWYVKPYLMHNRPLWLIHSHIHCISWVFPLGVCGWFSKV